VISWPKGIKPDKTPRPQFHHVNDIAPTIYDILGVKAPEVGDGWKQLPIDGVSMTYAFADAAAPGRKPIQYFENNGSRAIYHDGWIAATFGPLIPWLPVTPGLDTWDANKDRWELYDIRKDFSEADDLAVKEPERLAEMKKLFLSEAKDNQVFPVGAGLWTRLHPQDRVKVPYTHWAFDSTTTRLPEFAGPGLGRESNRVAVDLETDANASGVIYALGGIGGGLTLYMDKGQLVYEYNMMMIERYIGRSAAPIGAGKHRIVVDTSIANPGGPADVAISVDGAEAMRVDVKRTVPGAFSASETLDVGVDLGSPVSFDYFDRQPFAFDGKIAAVTVDLK
jgi:arylsulfatase